MEKRRRESIKFSTLLMLTPMLDMLTVVLIFLIVNFSPDKASIKQSKKVTLPNAELNLFEVPKIQVEVTKEYLKVNGKILEGIVPDTADQGSWKILKAHLDEIAIEHARLYRIISGKEEEVAKKPETKGKGKAQDEPAAPTEPILLIADKETPYELVDRTVAHLAAHGYGEIYLLTHKEERKNDIR
jgi:biopolymer transport protein ExbD